MSLDFVNLFRLWLDFLGFVFLFFGGLLLCLATFFTPKRSFIRVGPTPMIACGLALMVLAIVPIITCINKYNLIQPRQRRRCPTWTRQTAKEFLLLMGPTKTRDKDTGEVENQDGNGTNGVEELSSPPMEFPKSSLAIVKGKGNGLLDSSNQKARPEEAVAVVVVEEIVQAKTDTFS